MGRIWSGLYSKSNSVHVLISGSITTANILDVWWTAHLAYNRSRLNLKLKSYSSHFGHVICEFFGSTMNLVGDIPGNI